MDYEATVHERALGLILLGLSAACLLATIIAAAQGDTAWILVLFVSALGCYEASERIVRR